MGRSDGESTSSRGLTIRGLIAIGCCLAVRASLAGDVGQPGPLTDAHTTIIRPGDFRAVNGGPAPVIRSAEAAFSEALPITATGVQAGVAVRHAGEYAVWVRLARGSNPHPPVTVELLTAGRKLLSRRVNEDEGDADSGGPAGRRAYVRRAFANTPGHEPVKDSAVQLDRTIDLDAQLPPGNADSAEIDEFTEEITLGTADQWVTADRVEKAGVFSWWKIGQVQLAPGDHELLLRLSQPVADGATPTVDAAIVTGAVDLVYPFVGDITAPRAPYVRFRIDRVPPGGVTLACHLLTHIYPDFGTGAAFNPDGLAGKAVPHNRAGYTRWYCLEDLERAPGPEHYHSTFSLFVGGTWSNLDGATQFAMWPYGDAVVREIGWKEPSGLRISMRLDFEKHLDQLRTVRDHAREHYEEAVATTGGGLFPLTRLDLRLHTDVGGEEGSIDYAAKTLRLLGINSSGVGRHKPTFSRYHRAFGMVGMGGSNPKRGPFPADEATCRAHFQATYADLRSLPTDVAVYQISDEPSEQWGAQLSTPTWVYEEPPGREPRWVDYADGSFLHTRCLDYSNCVFEGAFERWGDFEWRIGCNASSDPTSGAWWLIGRVNKTSDHSKENVAWGVIDNGAEYARRYRGARIDPAADARKGTFRIVWEGTRAALYVNDKLLSMVDGVPAKGGLGMGANRKAVSGLCVRPIRPDERLAPLDSEPGLDAAAADASEVLLSLEATLEETFDEERADLPAWMKPKPLKQFVEEDWVAGGGIPEARRAYRDWLRERRVDPAVLGKRTLEEVSPMCIAELVKTPLSRREYYWARKFNATLMPRLFAFAMDGIRHNAPRQDIQGYVALSSDPMNLQQAMQMDMFELARFSNGLMPGISDWSAGKTGSEQVNAFNAAFFNAGGRRPGQAPASTIMMHCVHPSIFRTHTSLASNIKHLSFYTFGPLYVQPYIDSWSDRYELGCYPACSLINNRVTQVDDLVAPGLLRPSRVAMLYAMSSRVWAGRDIRMPDKRMAFLGLSHEYYQPELVNEDQVAAGALDHYDALYVLDAHADGPSRAKIAAWVEAGGLLWTSADAATRNEYDEPNDWLEKLSGLRRVFDPDASPADAAIETASITVSPVEGEADFPRHTVVRGGMPRVVVWPGARVRAIYDDGRPAWTEKAVGKGRVAYVGHRAGETYGSKIIRKPSNHWSDVGRSLLTAPLHEAGVDRECWLSEPCFMAGSLSTQAGTVIVMYNMQPAARKDVELFLKEPGKPHSVEIFDGYRLVPLPHEYADGRLTAKLPPFAGGQMVVVRRTAAPDDHVRKLRQMRTQAEELLGSADESDLSAGAFLAAADPSWNLAGKVASLVGHGSWLVRRQAAETLGRLGHSAAGDAIAAAAAKEQDAHALGDQILALARLKHTLARDRIQRHLGDASVHLKRMAVLATSELVSAGGDTDREFGLQVATAARAEPDIRVRREGIRLTGRLAPQLTVAAAAAAFAEGTTGDDKGRRFWVEAISANPAAFEEYLAQGCPAGGPLLCAVAAAAPPHPGLVEALEARLDSMTPSAADGQAMAVALAAQADAALAKKALERRAQLPPELVDHLPYVLDRIFNARLGNDLEAWERWAAGHP